MPRCYICGRKAKKTISRSHSMHKTIRRQKLNLNKTIYHGKKVLACASCMQRMVKVKK